MAVPSIEPSAGDGLDDDEPERDRITALSDRRAPLAEDKRSARLERGISATIHWLGPQFTWTDQAAMAAWARDPSHGYDRLLVERGVLEDGTWTNYALVYGPDQAWSIWGLMRRNDFVETWQCSTGKTVSHHTRMTDALASLPHATDQGRAVPATTSRTGTRSTRSAGLGC